MDEGFKTESFESLASLEANNFWFKIRNRIIIWTIKKYSLDFDSFLEIGCGTGFVTQAIAKEFTTTKVTGTEFLEEGLRYARQRSPESQFIQLDARRMLFKSHFSMIGAFDVIEHIKEDELVLNKAFQALKPNGTLFLTVPQHKWLWSQTDVQACHKRRYSTEELRQKVENAGFEVVRSYSFLTTLLPAMLLSRFIKKIKKTKSDGTINELEINPTLNKLFEIFMIIDFTLIKLGINLPVGGSRLIVGKKH